MNGAQRLVQTLSDTLGVEVLFGYPGGAIMPVYDALVDSPLKHYLMRHEQAAVHAAEGYALASGKLGVCMATSGPGATNLVTGVADAFLDSIPLLAITGQVASHLIGTDAFQEVDAVSLLMPVVKHNTRILDSSTLAQEVQYAAEVALSGRKGPVHLDLPRDIALSPVVEEVPFEPRPCQEILVSVTELERAVYLWNQAKRPLCYAGGGIFQGNAVSAFRDFVDKTRCPVVSTLKGLGVLPRDHPQFLGMMGMHGTESANRALRDCDLLVVLGARFDDRATGRLATFCPEARVIHLEIDPAEVGKLRQPDVTLFGPLAETLPRLTERLTPTAHVFPNESEEPEWPFEAPSPRNLLRAIDADFVTTDVGQHQMWAAQYLNFDNGMRLLTSGGLGTMGFGLPAAIGAQIACPDARVVCVTGDGSFMMMVHELATLRRFKLPVKIVLFDNSCLGMVRQWQELFFEDRESEVDLSDNPDFVAVARAFGIPAARLEVDADVPAAVADALRRPGPFLLHCVLERAANVWPLVPPGRANHDMMTEAVR